MITENPKAIFILKLNRNAADSSMAAKKTGVTHAVHFKNAELLWLYTGVARFYNTLHELFKSNCKKG